MPEGDTIRTLAQRLGPRLEGRRLVDAQSRWPRVVRGLTGREVGRLRTHGKHLLVPFDDATWLRIHLGLKGTWHRYAPGERWRRSQGDMGLVLATADDVLVCFFAKELERIRDKALSRSPRLASLGPDLLGDFDRSEALARALHDPGRPLREVLLDQSIAAGIGNEWCCELCFLHRLPLEIPVGEVGHAALGALLDDAVTRMRAAVGQSVRNTTGRRVPRTFVYGRRGEPCLSCGATVAMARLGPWARISYWCPTCQR